MNGALAPQAPTTVGAYFNCLVLCPSDLEFAKNCKKIIFLDEIYDTGYLNKINEISKAQVYIPKNNENNIKLILSLNLNRMELTKFYKNILKLENSGYTGVFAVYSSMVRDCKINISFNNFLAYFYYCFVAYVPPCTNIIFRNTI